MGDYGRPCYGYARTESPCAVCVLAHRLYGQDDNSAGFMEAREYPITITAYREQKEITVSGVREDSLTSKLDREGNVTLSFEYYGDSRIGYIPCVDWYTTECR